MLRLPNSGTEQQGEQEQQKQAREEGRSVVCPRWQRVCAEGQQHRLHRPQENLSGCPGHDRNVSCRLHEENERIQSLPAWILFYSQQAARLSLSTCPPSSRASAQQPLVAARCAVRLVKSFFLVLGIPPIMRAAIVARFFALFQILNAATRKLSHSVSRWNFAAA